MAFIGEDLQRLLQTLSKLPGLGTRSAKRLAFHLLKHKDTCFEALLENLHAVHRTYKACTSCGYWDDKSPCFFCISPHRESHILCVVEESNDVWVLEKAGIFRGRYHVLGGLLSRSQGYGVEALSLDPLMDRLDNNITEVILALNSTMEAQTTLYYIMTELHEHFPHIVVSRLSRGIPSGGELDYLDTSTLMNAFLERKPITEDMPSLTVGPRGPSSSSFI